LDNIFLVDTLAQDRAEEIFTEGGKTPAAWKAAQTFYKVSTGSETLMEVFEDYLSKADLPERTRKKYRTAVEEFVAFLGDGHHLVGAMNKKNALAYVDWLNAEGRSKRTKAVVPLSKNSKRDRIMALSVFWNQGLFLRGRAPEPVNPWAKLKPTEKPTASAIKWDNKGNTGRPQRRSGFDDEELLAILDAPGPSEGRKTVYAKRTLMEVFCLGLITGARPDELCSLRLKNIREHSGAFWLNIDDPKNEDSIRRIPVVHSLGQGILRRRVGDRKDGQAQLFEEFRAKKGHDSLYELVGRALSRHLQRAADIAENAVPYCTRHTLQTNMVARPEVKGVVLERYVGHKPSTTAGRHYLTITPSMLLDFARLVSYAPDVEARMAQELGIEAPQPEGKVPAESQRPLTTEQEPLADAI
jgi:integrase